MISRKAIRSLKVVHFSCLSQKQSVRNKSTRSAINRGLNATVKFAEDGFPRRRSSPRFPSNKTSSFRNDVVKASHFNGSESNQRRQTLSRTPRERTPRERTDEHRPPARRLHHEPDSDNHYQIPLSVPRTTAASQFLYGANVVLAALRARRRKLYQLFTLSRDPKPDSPHDSAPGRRPTPTDRSDSDLITLARIAKIPHRREGSPALLDKMSDGRPHNGIILEASTIPSPPVKGLGKPNSNTSSIPVTLDPQSAEDLAVNGAVDSIPIDAKSWRHPLVVMLDGIVDPENVGSILRSCHFYGVDAVAISTNTCAPLSSPVLAKASSGACEAVQLLSLPRPSEFVYESVKAGWEVFAAVAPAEPHMAGNSREVLRQKTTAEISEESPLAQKPCILMLGSEGQGLRENLRRRAKGFVTIERGQGAAAMPDVGVDSMNVGVAAGVLLEAFMRKPSSAPARKDNTGDLGW